jgi:dinuclear metal center YbgI/SA1388 family protein
MLGQIARMMKALLIYMNKLPTEISIYLDGLFEPDPGDQAHANNGLQVDAGTPVSKIAIAVDACLEAFEMAKESGCQMIIAHHGIFWTGHDNDPRAIDIHGKRLSYLFKNGISVWSCHLPLDIHPEFGNNAMLAKLLGFSDVKPFGAYHGKMIGLSGTVCTTDIEAIAEKLEQNLPECTAYAWSFGKESIGTIGVVSGGGDFAIPEAGRLGLDLIITGEMSHQMYHTAREYGINVICAGHWSTETVGIRAVGEKLCTHFGLESQFLSIPTGL